MWLNSFFCIWISSCSSTIYWKDYLCSIVLLLLFCWISIDYIYWLYLISTDYIYRLSIMSHLSEVIQSCPTLCHPMDCSIPACSVHGILQARILEWVAISFSRGSSWPRNWPRSPTLQADVLPSEPPRKHIPFNCLLFLPISHSLV